MAAWNTIAGDCNIDLKFEALKKLKGKKCKATNSAKPQRQSKNISKREYVLIIPPLS